MRRLFFIVPIIFSAISIAAQNNAVSRSWNPMKNETEYRNPVIHADYSDPDVVRVGDDFYMTASSFNHVPGLPLLHSRDLVHWKLLGHALERLVPEEHFSKVQHGGGVWAPSIRFHKGEFYIYYPDPDFGIYLIKAKSINGPWTKPQLVMEGEGLIDPCPLWDDDGKAWIVYAFAGSRAGIKSVLAVRQLSPDGTKTLDEGRIIYDGHEQDPTVEGPKIYKRNGWYYIFAPAGGVATGWQIVLRSKSIYGPYERKQVLLQGTTQINGPHQGAWVTTPQGNDWFLHFQDLEAYGRIVHLQPMVWKNDWPVMGEDKDADGTGEPVLTYKPPIAIKNKTEITPPESDAFDFSQSNELGKQWQWQANPKSSWAFPMNGQLRLYAQTWPDSISNLWMAPHLLMQKFPALQFQATTEIKFSPRSDGDLAGMIVFGADYGYIGMRKKGEKFELIHAICNKAEKGSPEKLVVVATVNTSKIWLRLSVNDKAIVQFYYSADGNAFQPVGESFEAKPGKWVGAKMGLFCNQQKKTNDAGWVDVQDWRVDAWK